MESPAPAAKNTNAFFAQSALSFGTAVLAMLVAIVRDAQENQYVVSRIDQARVDRILAEHDPWKEVA